MDKVVRNAIKSTITRLLRTEDKLLLRLFIVSYFKVSERETNFYHARANGGVSVAERHNNNYDSESRTRHYAAFYLETQPQPFAV